MPCWTPSCLWPAQTPAGSHRLRGTSRRGPMQCGVEMGSRRSSGSPSSTSSSVSAHVGPVWVSVTTVHTHTQPYACHFCMWILAGASTIPSNISVFHHTWLITSLTDSLLSACADTLDPLYAWVWPHRTSAHIVTTISYWISLQLTHTSYSLYAHTCFHPSSCVSVVGLIGFMERYKSFNPNTKFVSRHGTHQCRPSHTSLAHL